MQLGLVVCMKTTKLKKIPTNFHSLQSLQMTEIVPTLNVKERLNKLPPLKINKKDILKETYSPVPEIIKKNNIISNADLAALFLEKFIFLSVEDSLYHWNSTRGVYVAVTLDYAETFIRRNTPDIYRNKINSSTIKEVIQWIKSELYHEHGNIASIDKNHLIAFSNGVFNIDNQKFISHSPENFFTSTVNAEYRGNQNLTGQHFLQFMLDVCNGNTDLYLRVQELFGYVISEIRSVKYIPYLLGPKDTGKSIVLKVLENLVGKDSYTNLSFDQLNKPEYLAQLLGKRLNTCGETSEFKLNKLDIFKKLSGGDHVTARPIYGQPINFVNKAVLLFAGNHLPTINGLDKSNAFSQRIIIFPFTHQIPKSKQDPQLIEKILDEKDYIIQWAIEGLIRWKSNNYQFTSCEEIEELTTSYYEQNNSIDSFVKYICDVNVSGQIYKCKLQDSYLAYCKSNDITPESMQVLHQYMKSLPYITYKRFRDGLGNNKYGYIGIELRNEEV